jgi:nitroreductase
MSTPSTRLTRELVRLACLAPSVSNTQPWSWRIVAPREVELYADPARWLPAADPLGRELLISCGAALDHFEVAAASFGLTARTEEFPRSEDPDLLARITLGDGTLTEAGVESLAALENRHTDRHGATDRPVPTELVQPLGQAATREGARVVVLTDPWEVDRTEQLIEVARRSMRTDGPADVEQDGWLDRSDVDGIPGIVADPSHDLEEHRAPTRFERHVRAHDAQTEHAGVLALVCTDHDDPRAWLWAGRSLSAFWLAVTTAGLALTPTTQVMEVARTRHLLRHDVLGGLLNPQAVVRVGWPSPVATRPSTPRTARRDLDDVLQT